MATYAVLKFALFVVEQRLFLFIPARVITIFLPQRFLYFFNVFFISGFTHTIDLQIEYGRMYPLLRELVCNQKIWEELSGKGGAGSCINIQ